MTAPPNVPNRDDLVMIIEEIARGRPSCEFSEAVKARFGSHQDAVCMLAGSKVISISESTLHPDAVEVVMRSPKGSDEMIVLTHSNTAWHVESVWIIDG